MTTFPESLMTNDNHDNHDNVEVNDNVKVYQIIINEH